MLEYACLDAPILNCYLPLCPGARSNQGGFLDPNPACLRRMVFDSPLPTSWVEDFRFRALEFRGCCLRCPFLPLVLRHRDGGDLLFNERRCGHLTTSETTELSNASVALRFNVHGFGLWGLALTL